MEVAHARESRSWPRSPPKFNTTSQLSLIPDDGHPSMPSAGAVANGAAAPAWGPDPSMIPESAQPVQDPGYGPLQSAVALGLERETIEGAARFWAGELPLRRDELAALDTTHRAEATAELQQLWGADMGANLQNIDRYLNTLPASAGAMLRVLPANLHEMTRQAR